MRWGSESNGRDRPGAVTGHPTQIAIIQGRWYVKSLCGNLAASAQ